jgi:hypothetical protein
LYVNTLLLFIVASFFVCENYSSNQYNLFQEYISTIFSIWFVLYCIISIINIISVIINYRNNDRELLFNKMKRVKIGLIPFWIINFICYVPISTLLLIGQIGFLLVPIFIFASYMVLCLTSLFSISYLLNLKKNNHITTEQFITHSVLQLFFVVDIIDVFYMIKKWGKPNNML